MRADSALAALAATAFAAAGAVPAAAAATDQPGAIQSPLADGVDAPSDILAAHVSAEGSRLTFRLNVAGQAGSMRPDPAGALAGAPVFAYVWPTTLDASSVGFEPEAGLLALAATAHPDFDDTPLYDENGDGDLVNDGAGWHSHWVVLGPNEACGAGALAVIDIPEGAKPALPATWPGLPLLIDSPGFTPLFNGGEVSLTVALPSGVVLAGTAYDGVTAALRVNADLHAPLLCVTDVWDVASGDLSLPGRVD
jgi:hypothetical protein